jgi:hypothetical protein
MKRGIGILIVLLVVFAACIGFYTLTPHEPSYKGRSLSYWLRQIDDGERQNGLNWQAWTTNGSEAAVKAREAIRQMGTNSIPFLLQRLTNQDPGLKNKVLTILGKQRWIKFPAPETNATHRAAALAFDALGPAAKDAASNLVAVLIRPQIGAEDDSPKCATIALAAIDPKGTALFPLVRSNGWEGTCAIWGLASHHIKLPPEVIQSLINSVTNKNNADGAISAWALGESGQDAEHVIPALIQGFHSKDLGTRWGSAYGLGLWGTNATSAIPVLSEGLKDPDSTIRNYAKEALKKIDPKGSLKEEDK